MRKVKSERLGVAAMEYFFSEAGWLFREQPIHDYGIDAHVEIFDDHYPTGKLVALQIKSGQSFFREEATDGFVFRSDEAHVNYWVNHSMPVVIVLFNPETKEAFWQQISSATVESTGKDWKINVPKVNVLKDSAKSLKWLNALTQPEPYIRRLNRLRVDRYWMERIEEGDEIRVQFDDWVNKSLSRFQINVIADDETEAWPTVYTPGVGIEGMLSHFFPWAYFSLDREAHAEAAEDERGPFAGEYEPPRDEIVPVSENGETATYILILSLNDFGRAFLAVDDYLTDSSTSETIGFILERESVL